MTVEFKEATASDAETIASMVIELTREISRNTQSKIFNINSEDTISTCLELLSKGHYSAIIALSNNVPVAVSTYTESYALYAGGKIGVIQEFFVAPEYRASGIGSQLLDKVRDYGVNNNWMAIELTTPPLPEFERTLNFYQKNGLTPVGGRKMRESINCK